MSAYLDSPKRRPRWLVGLLIATTGAVVLATIGWLLFRGAEVGMRSGVVEIPLTGELSRDGYVVLPIATATSNAPEQVSYIELKIEGTDGEKEMPRFAVSLPGLGATCSADPGREWLQSGDQKYASAILMCEPFVRMGRFEGLDTLVLEE